MKIKNLFGVNKSSFEFKLVAGAGWQGDDIKYILRVNAKTIPSRVSTCVVGNLHQSPTMMQLMEFGASKSIAASYHGLGCNFCLTFKLAGNFNIIQTVSIDKMRFIIHLYEQTI